MVKYGRIFPVDRNASESVERFPRDAARVSDPVLVRLRVTAGLLVLLDQPLVRGLQLRLHPSQFLVRIDLESQVIDSGWLMVGGDREVNSRILQHPLGVVRFHNDRLTTEELGVELDALAQIRNGHVYVKTLHETFLLRGEISAGIQARPPQQFSCGSAP